jgi:drug/metabolite transporter (DMT)-like permease
MTKPQTAASGPRQRPANPFAHPYLLLVIAPLMWGGNTIAGKLAVGNIEPVTQTIIRFILAFLLVLPFARPHLRRDWPHIKAGFWWLMLYGTLGFSLFNILMFTAQKYTTSINVSIEQAAIPVLVMAANFTFFKVRARFLQVVGVGLTIWGIILVATYGDPSRILDLSVNFGDVLVVLAAALYAFYSLTLKYRPDIHWLSFLLVTFFGAAVSAILYQLAFGGGVEFFLASLPRVTPTGWSIIVYAAIFPSIVSQLCYAMGVGKIGPNRASLFINLVPVFGTIGSIVIIGETPQLFHITAAVFVISGIVLAEWSSRTIKTPG